MILLQAPSRQAYDVAGVSQSIFYAVRPTTSMPAHIITVSPSPYRATMFLWLRETERGTARRRRTFEGSTASKCFRNWPRKRPSSRPTRRISPTMTNYRWPGASCITSSRLPLRWARQRLPWPARANGQSGQREFRAGVLHIGSAGARAWGDCRRADTRSQHGRPYGSPLTS